MVYGRFIRNLPPSRNRNLKKRKRKSFEKSILELNNARKDQKTSPEEDKGTTSEKEVVPESISSPTKTSKYPPPEPDKPCECLTLPIRTVENSLIAIQAKLSTAEEKTDICYDHLAAKIDDLERNNTTLLSSINEQQSVVGTLVTDVLHIKSSHQLEDGTQQKNKLRISKQKMTHLLFRR